MKSNLPSGNARDVQQIIYQAQAQNSLKLAKKIVVLHPEALRELDTTAPAKQTSSINQLKQLTILRHAGEH